MSYIGDVSLKQSKIIPGLAVGLSTLLIGWYLFSLTAHNTFTFDEWMFFTGRREWTFNALVANHNGHLSIVPAFVYIAVFKIFGYDHYEVFRLLAVIIHLATTLLAADFVRRRHGWPAAYCVGIALALLGGGGENILWGFQIGFMGGLFFFLLALRFFDHARDSTHPKWAVASCIAVALSLGSAGTGIGSVVVIFVLTVFSANWRRLWWVSVLPGMLYAGWYVRYGGTEASTSVIHAIPSFVAKSASSSAAAIFGIDRLWGTLALGIVISYLAHKSFERKLSRRSFAFLIFAGFFWVATAYGRALFADPASSRYLYIGIFGLVLLLSDSLPMSASLTDQKTKIARVVVGVASALAIWGSHSAMMFWSDIHLSLSESAIGQLALVEAHRNQIDPSTLLQTIGSAPVLVAQDYFAAIDAIGSSPVDGVTELVSASAQTRLAADDVLFSLGLASIGGTGESDLSCIKQLDPEVLVLPGSELKFAVSRQVTATMARFFDLYSRGVNDRVLGPGIYVVSLSEDSLGGGLRIAFDDATAVTFCE